MFEFYIRKRHFGSTYIQRKYSSQFPASRLKSVDTIGSYCEITRAGCALTSMHDVRIQQRYTGGGGVGGEEEKNISFEYKNVRNFLH